MTLMGFEPQFFNQKISFASIKILKPNKKIHVFLRIGNILNLIYIIIIKTSGGIIFFFKNQINIFLKKNFF